jgi:hypothetical protein
LKFQIVEREFRDLDEVLIWVDRNQLGRRNLTDEQRAVVIGRLYKTVKQNPILNLKPFQKDNGDRGENFSPLSGPHATAEAIAVQIGVSYRTVQNAAKFADAVEALQEVSTKAAERVLRSGVNELSAPSHKRGSDFRPLCRFARQSALSASQSPDRQQATTGASIAPQRPFAPAFAVVGAIALSSKATAFVQRVHDEHGASSLNEHKRTQVHALPLSAIRDARCPKWLGVRFV